MKLLFKYKYTWFFEIFKLLMGKENNKGKDAY